MNILPNKAYRRLHAYAIWGICLISFCIGGVSPATGYNPITHRQIVTDAVDFVVSQSEMQDFAIQSLTDPNVDDVGKKNEERLLGILGQSAFEADYKDDVFFRYTKWYGRLFAFVKDLDECFSRHGDLSFTSMQHFMVIPQQPGRIWQIDGYSYEYTDRDRDDLDYLAFSSFVVDWSGVKLDTEICQRELPPWWSTGVYQPGNYQNNMGQYLKYVVFPPASNMANYFYDKFMHDVGVNGKPSSQALNYLGRVMHLIQDMTVPHHVIGTLGQKHQEYEKNVDAWYVMGLAPLRDDGLIQKQLKEVPCLNTDCTMTQMLNEVAEYTRRAEISAGHLNITNGRYAIGVSDDEAELHRTTELVNLAIAANVAILKKAAKDWSATHASASKSQSNPQSGIVMTPSTVVGRESRYFEDFSQISPELFIGSRFLALLSPSDKTEVLGIMGSTQSIIIDFENGQLTRSQFVESIDAKALRLEEFLRNQIQTRPQLLSSPAGRINTQGLGSISFRKPTKQERTHMDQWRAYNASQERFLASIQFVNQVIITSMLGIEEKHRRGTTLIPDAAIAGSDSSSNEAVMRDLTKAKDKFISLIRD